ncbi:helix-turn-helix domain-containing protein [Amycolatopsis anabasis]|uniref:helix-turn-helix domain-containing protein n=1 Tax=Amycolatopsis anabasis TaxID=1840409 RepID=UPI00131D2EBD|nr:AraC family transcriptional regulator [Amycolatopsis anabasis]
MSTRIPECLVNAVVTGARHAPVDLGRLLKCSGLATFPPSATDREGISRLLRTLSRELDDDLFGLAPWRVPRGAFATMCLGAVHGGDLGSALRRLCRFYRLFPGLPVPRVIRHAQLASFVVELPMHQKYSQVLIEAALFVVQQFSGWLIGRPIPLHSLEFPHPAPPPGQDCRLISGVPKLFLRGRACLTFAADVLDAPVIRTERDLRTLLAEAPASLLLPIGPAPALAVQVRELLRRSLPDRLPSAEAIAARLILSPPTFRRRLHQEGTSYAAIRDTLLRELAVTALTEEGQTVRQVAARLGYSEPSAFRRAFRRWTGLSPNAFRPAPVRPVPEPRSA